MDNEFGSVSALLKQPFWKLFSRVTVPVCMPFLLDIMIYLFVNTMRTASAVVFLYSSDTSLASIAVLNMDDAGDVAPAAAMGMIDFLFERNCASHPSEHNATCDDANASLACQVIFCLF